MNRKTEFQYKRLFEVIGNRPSNKIWELDELLKAVNRLIPKHLEISSRSSIASLIMRQHKFKVFKCKYGPYGIYYIFKTKLPVV